jgi:hypothetical protein
MRILKILIAVALLVILGEKIFTIQHQDTDELMQHAEAVLKGEIDQQDTTAGPLRVYNPNMRQLGYSSIEYELSRLLVFHNFADGYILVRYSQCGYDDKGDLSFGSWRIPAIWKIHKTGDKWEVVEVIEHP